MTSDHVITDLATLTSHYPEPVTRARLKESSVITAGYARFLAAAPFAVLATHGEGGLDCSPRGDGPGFVDVLDERTLLLPDRRGNNRLDSLSNIIRNPEIGLIFFVPGVGEAVRVRGTAVISTDPALIDRFEMAGTFPATVLVVTVARIYFQCQRALKRSHLWEPETWPDRSAVPTAGQLQADVGALSREETLDYDAELDDYVARTLYSGASRR